MRIRFTKMHGLGNDFVMIDSVSRKVNITPEKARKIADRHFGIGCDQILIVEPPRTPYADFRYRIFNYDGTEVENCGNGARCFALFVQQRNLTNKNCITVETAAGDLVLEVLEDQRVTVDMGIPVLDPAQVPFEAATQQTVYPLTVNGTEFEISAVSMGNPHAVTLVNDVDNFPVLQTGPQIEAHSSFPSRVNAGFMQIIDNSNAKLRVFERGVGETLACGTGACAAAVAGQLRGKLGHEVNIHLPGGTLQIEWQGLGHHVKMTGPATTVFHGQVRI